MPLSRDEKNNLAHLMRRAGFGLSPDDWQEYSRIGIEATTESLLHPERAPDALSQLQTQLGGNLIDFDNLDNTRSWWLYRMAFTKRPLEEKMTLFWHNHFATANFKVNNARWMWQQNETFRRHALGNFRTMLQAVSRDGAMLVWLDGAESHNDAPNENYGRELLELFTMGQGNGYTEADIKGAARSFTGWRYDPPTNRWRFDPFRHDDNWKTFLGQSGNFHGDDILDIIARRPETARFLASKLFRFFVHDDPSDADLAPLEKAYFDSGFEVRAMLAAIFNAPSFYSEKARYALIKSPVDFVVMTLRTLEVKILTVNKIDQTIAEMGQELFNPPSVKGWDGGRAWINSRTLLSRVNFATDLANRANERGTLDDLVKKHLDATVPDYAERWSTCLLYTSPSPRDS